MKDNGRKIPQKPLRRTALNKIRRNPKLLILTEVNGGCLPVGYPNQGFAPMYTFFFSVLRAFGSLSGEWEGKSSRPFPGTGLAGSRASRYEEKQVQKDKMERFDRHQSSGKPWRYA
ncbi:hypothetical protein OFAG_02143 [Oxalobacter formigenes HOxBLS]|uniref:Uncharacterized protein n=1 Tax=Oxalobacter paraformigenes TaxID=556268 RepID=T5LQ20_9BURK|nr:hypothetical protein OFAG_02143 [Oxalobacter paraformigenes]